MLLVVNFGLIGDTLGLIPVIDALAEKCKKEGDELYVCVHYDGRPVLEMAEGYRAGRWKFADDKGDGKPHGSIKQINLPRCANTLGHKRYLTAAYFDEVGLPIPEDNPRPKISVWNWADAFDEHVISDYGLAPFARSLPDGSGQKWPRHRWQELVDALPEKRFILYGSEKRGDDPGFVKGPNVTPFFDRPLETVCKSLRTLKSGLLSVSTGLSHLAYAMEVTNYLLIWQGPFCFQPDAITLKPLKMPGDITVTEVLELIT